jgi:hypothetical protein
MYMIKPVIFPNKAIMNTGMYKTVKLTDITSGDVGKFDSNTCFIIRDEFIVSKLRLESLLEFIPMSRT